MRLGAPRATTTRPHRHTHHPAIPLLRQPRSHCRTLRHHPTELLLRLRRPLLQRRLLHHQLLHLRPVGGLHRKNHRIPQTRTNHGRVSASASVLRRNHSLAGWQTFNPNNRREADLGCRCSKILLADWQTAQHMGGMGGEFASDTSVFRPLLELPTDIVRWQRGRERKRVLLSTKSNERSRMGG